MGRVRADGEPLWLPDDTEAALQWQAEQRSICTGCGQHLDESMDPSAARLELYEARSVRCHGCAEIGRKQGDDQANKVSPDGLRYRVIRHEAGAADD